MPESGGRKAGQVKMWSWRRKSVWGKRRNQEMLESICPLKMMLFEARMQNSVETAGQS